MNQRPDSDWTPSPNFHQASGRKITCVVMHDTASHGVESPKEWLCDPTSKVSAHYLIGKDGKIYHLVHESNIAWHAGESTWREQSNVNEFSVGVELENTNDGQDPYPEEQLAAATALVVAICKDYGVKLADVVGHLDVAPGRKTDPAGFPWDDFRGRLTAAGIS